MGEASLMEYDAWKRCMELEDKEMFFLIEYATGYFIEPFVVNEITFKDGKVFLGSRKFPLERCFATADEAERARRGGAEHE